MPLADLPYSGGSVDRCGGMRADDESVRALLSAPGAQVLPLWRDRCLVEGERPVRLPAARAADVLGKADATVFLGTQDATPLFAADLSGLELDDALCLAGGTDCADVRALVGALSPIEADAYAYARGLLHWHRNQRFCGTCGSTTTMVNAGHARRCLGEACGRLLFGRIEPAVIVVVEAPTPPRRCLLARHAGAGPDSYSLLAGFVEVSESLEGAVRREVAEEAGLIVDNVRYVASQAWPFPAGLMVGFFARSTSEEIAVDGSELVEARWFTPDELAERAARGHRLGRPDSIDARLLSLWAGRSRVTGPMRTATSTG